MWRICSTICVYKKFKHKKLAYKFSNKNNANIRNATIIFKRVEDGESNKRINSNLSMKM